MGGFPFQQLFGMLFVLAILAIIFRYPYGRNRRHRRAEREHEEELRTVNEHNADLRRQIDQLEERIRVLERIVTDDPNELKRQFRDLGS